MQKLPTVGGGTLPPTLSPSRFDSKYIQKCNFSMHQIAQFEVYNCKSSLPWEGVTRPTRTLLLSILILTKYIENCNFSIHQIAQFDV